MTNTNASRACTCAACTMTDSERAEAQGKYEAAYKLATIAHAERDAIDSCFSPEWRSAQSKCKALYAVAAAIKPGNRNHRVHEAGACSQSATWRDLHG